MSNNKTKITIFHDDRGSLIPFEFSNLSFTPKRIFIVNGVSIGTIRGNHSHYSTKQFIICTKGSVNVLLDDGYKKNVILLLQGESILIPELVWDSQEFLEKDSEILVICSSEYDVSDYIFDYNEFLNIISK